MDCCYGCSVVLTQVVCVHISWLATVGTERHVVKCIQHVMSAQLLLQLVRLNRNHHDSALH